MKLKSLKRVLLTFFPVLLLVILSLILSRLSTFSIKKITCELDHYPCSLDFEPTLVQIYHKNIFTPTKNQVIKSLTVFDQNLTDINITKKLPNQLIITVKRRQPIAQLIPFINLEFIGLDGSASATLSGEITNQFFKLDEEGEIFVTDNHQSSLYPVVAVPESFDFNLKSSPATRQISQLIRSLQTHYVSFNLLAWLNQSMAIIKTSLGSYAIINLNQSVNSQVASLQYILSGFKIGESLPKKIDLRFDKPVLTF